MGSLMPVAMTLGVLAPCTCITTNAICSNHRHRSSSAPASLPGFGTSAYVVHVAHWLMYRSNTMGFDVDLSSHMEQGLTAGPEVGLDDDSLCPARILSSLEQL